MVLLIARSGLRAPEVIAIQIDDIDWRAGEILIRGKGKRHDRVPLPPDVGEALTDYIKRDRTTTSRYLFVTGRPPHPPFNTALFLRWQEMFGRAQKQTWAHRLGTVRVFAQWLHSMDSKHEVPPQSLIPSRVRRPHP